MAQNQIARWDCTLTWVETDSPDYIVARLKAWCKKWCFQLELGGQTEYKHWQIRVSLASKIRPTNHQLLIDKVFPGRGYWTPTSNGIHPNAKEFSYVMKEITRLEGPWCDTDVEPPPLTRQLRMFMKHDLRPWQDTVLSWCSQEDDRSIKVIYDTIGNSGKSIFSEFLEYKGLALEIPPMRHMEDIMQCVMGQHIAKAYLIDMPRAMKKDKLGDFYSGLEALKNGIAYDKRYAFKKVRFDRPQVIVFTNTLPDFNMLSADRWEIWEMHLDYALKPWEAKVSL